jgi:hypothetical protein
VQPHRIGIFVDESGDLGLTFGRSSKFLVVCAVRTWNPSELERIARKAYRRFRDIRTGELKFNREGLGVRKFVLQEISRTDCCINWAALCKVGDSRHRNGHKSMAYNKLCAEVLGDAFAFTTARSIDVIMDSRRSTTRQRREFEQMVGLTLRRRHTGFFCPTARIRHLDSIQCKSLQVVDFVAGAAFHSVEYQDDSYLSLIQSRITSSRIIS